MLTTRLWFLGAALYVVGMFAESPTVYAIGLAMVLGLPTMIPGAWDDDHDVREELERMKR